MAAHWQGAGKVLGSDGVDADLVGRSDRRTPERNPKMRRNTLSRSLRSMAAVAVLSVAPVVVGASSASALAVNQTVCYRSDGSAVINPLNQDGFEYCVTRSGTA